MHSLWTFVSETVGQAYPDFTGKGFAQQLVAYASNNIFDRGKQAFLHVLKSNDLAIKLYLKLGFTTKRQISFWNIKRN